MSTNFVSIVHLRLKVKLVNNTLFPFGSIFTNLFCLLRLDQQLRREEIIELHLLDQYGNAVLHRGLAN